MNTSRVFLFGIAITLCCTLGITAAGQDEASAAEAAETAPATVLEETPSLGTSGPVVVITVDSIIHPIAADYIIESIEFSEERNAAALVIQLNTPGGLLTSTREIFKAMLSSEVPVVVFVGPSGAQAASAGFFILMAADVAAMAPGTNTGAAHPVQGQGQDIGGDMRAKVEQDAAATIRSLANQQGRNPELAEAAVIESNSFTADEALENDLIDLVADDLDALLEAIDGREIRRFADADRRLATASAEVVEHDIGTFKSILSAISHPNIAYILMSLGFLGLYMEISNPGAILPGVAGAIFLILGFYALSVLPINYAGVALLLLALVLFIAETQVPTFGLLTLGGAISLVLGAIMLFRDADPALRVHMPLVITMAAVTALIGAGLSTKALSVRRGRVTTGQEGLVTEIGEVRTALDPRGKVFVHGEIWYAESARPVGVGQRVQVVGVDGMTLKVEPVAEPSPSSLPS